MCLALPARVVEILDQSKALVEQNGRVRSVSVQLLPEVQKGDFILLNLGVAVQKLTETEAQEILDLWQQISRSIANDQAARYEVTNE